MKNLANVAQLEAELELPPEIGLVQFAVQDEENNVIYIVGNSLYVVTIDATSLAVRFQLDLAKFIDHNMYNICFLVSILINSYFFLLNKSYRFYGLLM
jgi:hypothetical protein